MMGRKGGRRKLHNEELRDLNPSPRITRLAEEDEMGEACSTNVAEMKGV
jgi:hypothetical protein